MQIEAKKIPHIIIYVLSILILGYMLYESVYNQIISQSDGFFNMIIFAGILLLVFILLSLIVKLMAYTPTRDISSVFKYVMLAVSMLLIIFSAIMKINYSSSIPADESAYFTVCEYINEGLLSEASDVFDELLYRPGIFPFAFISSFIFKITSLQAEYIVLINVFYLSVCAILIYLLTTLMTDQICGFIAFLLVLFMPGTSFAVYSYGYEIFFAAHFLMVAYLFSLLIHKKYEKIIIPIIISIFAAIFAGIMIFSEPSSLLIWLALFIWMICKKNQGIVPYIIIPILTILIFISFVLIKGSMMETELSEVFLGYISALNPLTNDISGDEIEFVDFLSSIGKYIDNQNKHILDNYYFLTSKSGKTYSSLQAIWLQLGNQLIYMFMIILCVANIIYLLKAKIDRVTPFLSVFIASFFVQAFGAKYATNGIYFCIILIALGSSTIQHMFLNHHPDVSDILLAEEGSANGEADTGEIAVIQEEIDPAEIERARALTFYGFNDSLYERIKLEEKQSKMNDPIAAKRILTAMEDGKYISKVEEVEYFDEIDTPVEVKPEIKVKAIPGTRPVEVVKPILADEVGFLDEPDDNPALNLSSNISVKPEDVSMSNQEEKDDFENQSLSVPEIKDQHEDQPLPVSDIKDESEVKPANIQEGFVIRKRGDKPADKPVIKPTVKTDIKKEEKIAVESSASNDSENKKEKRFSFKSKKKDESESKKDTKIAKKQEKAKKGEPLHNPLPLPKPHVSKDFDFDIDVSDDDDFDV